MPKARELFSHNAIGTVSPSEYDWRKQFDELPSLKGYGNFMQLDSGKIYGLARALHETLELLEEHMQNTEVDALNEPDLVDLVQRTQAFLVEINKEKQ